MKSSRMSRLTSSLAMQLLLLAAAAASVFPFYWILTGATNASVDILKAKLSFGQFLGANYMKLNDVYHVWVSFYNTAFVAVVSCALMLIICSLAAFAFAKYSFKGRDALFVVFMLSMMIPFCTTMIPLFRMLMRYKILDSFTGVILPGIAPMFLLFFFRQSFLGFPNEIIEAARIDGATELKIILSIVFPAMRSTFAAGIIWSFMTNWNNYLWPLLVIQTDGKKTLPLLLATLSASYRNIDYGMMMVAIVIATLPIVVIYFLMQKQFITGIVGATKG